jgi:hypothetical protein
MPEHLRLESLVENATEPRVKAVGVDMLAQGGQGLADSCQGGSEPLQRAAAVREALSLFKVCHGHSFELQHVICSSN